MKEKPKMNQLDLLIKSLFHHDLTILAARPMCGRPEITTELIYQYAILKNYKTLIISLDGDFLFYLKYLLNRLTNIPIKLIESYLNPTLGCSKTSACLPHEKYMAALEQIRNSKLIINDHLFTPNDYLDYILEYNELEPQDLIIISSLDALVKESKYSLSDILTKLKESAQKYHTHFLFWNQINAKAEAWPNQIIKPKYINHYSLSRKYVSNLILLERKRNVYHNNLDELIIRHYENQKFLTFSLAYDYANRKLLEVPK